MNDDFDDLDRALFALPLDEPPSGLRESILRATVYAPLVAPAPFSTIETIGIGIALALATWIAWLCVADHGIIASLDAGALQFVRALADTETFVWLGIGGLTAAWISIAFAQPFQSPFGRRTP